MGYLDNSAVTVDAILTRRGRELLARGRNEFNITHFALADDEIDYSLWNTDHPLGSAYYGSVIENLPITEAVPSEDQVMKFPLVSLPKKTQRIPIISVQQSSITLNSTVRQSEIITPATENYTNGNVTYGYTFILADSDIAELEVAQQSQIPFGPQVPAPTYENEDAQPQVVHGLAVRVRAKPQITNKTTTLTIIGNETGGRATVNITVKKLTI